ncbi:hypothetical protein BHE74_00049560 [Ensete ventricosum]|nr:hypothetical protein BHE74_00049560 [Ensete ventricosum]
MNLDHWLAEDLDEGFSGEAGRGETGGNDPYHPAPVLAQPGEYRSDPEHRDGNDPCLVAGGGVRGWLGGGSVGRHRAQNGVGI